MKSYLIAFRRKPKANFLPMLLQLCKNDGVIIAGAILCEGPGCYNLAMMVPDATPESLVDNLTMALMPARYSVCTDPELVKGEYIDKVNAGIFTFEDPDDAFAAAHPEMYVDDYR